MTNPAVDYRALQNELDEVLTSLQSGDLTIDEALKAYERGQEIVAQLEKYLKQAENKIKNYSNLGDDG
jgi:exodeoxyribonuclease VII small subunit